jgi:hypothetical protein|nr:MAG TPA: hypothetical protein [Caudoviricetes sp.]
MINSSSDYDKEVIKKEVYSGYLNKMKNRLFGLLCEKEKQGEWEKFLDTILIELIGFPDDSKGINYYTLFYKVSSLKYLDYTYFRKTIFECMNLVDSLGRSGDFNGLP